MEATQDARSDREKALEERVAELEKQVRGLMETVTAIHEKLSINYMGVGRPDVYILPASDPRRTQHLAFKVPTVPTPVTMPSVTSPSTNTGPKAPTPIKHSGDVLSNEPFVYAPLDKDKSQVRILALKKETGDGAHVRCRLIVIDLDDLQHGKNRHLHSPEYQFTPLSYTWGDASNKAKIYIDGRPLEVTAALHVALRRLRRLDSNILASDAKIFELSRAETPTETFWWIDAICVNQQDLDERAHQVSLMTQLYRSAKLVNVWLGEKTETTATAMRLVRYIGYKPVGLEDERSWTYIRKPGQTHRPAGPGKPHVKLPIEWIVDSAEEKATNYAALIALFSRPWFSRVWVRQEIALPSAVRIHCGDEQCTWDELMRAAATLAYYADDHGAASLQNKTRFLTHATNVSCFQNAIALDEVRSATSSGSRYIAFKDLAFHTRDCLSTDPRDKVYAMLPLTDPDEVPVVADYRKSQFEAYEMVLTTLMRSSLDFLAACQYGISSPQRPSWVPDFSQPWIAQPIWPYLNTQRSLRDNDYRHDKPQIEYADGSPELKVSGIVLDELVSIHEEKADPTLSMEKAQVLIKTWSAFAQAHRRALLDESIDKGFDWQSFKFINTCYDETVWQKMCLDPRWDIVSRTPASKAAEYAPIRDRRLADDPVFRRMQGTLLVDDNAESIAACSGLSHFRRLAVGRRVAVSASGLTCLVPEATHKGDQVAWLKGATETFILRPRADGAWSIVGGACK